MYLWWMLTSQLWFNFRTVKFVQNKISCWFSWWNRLWYLAQNITVWYPNLIFSIWPAVQILWPFHKIYFKFFVFFVNICDLTYIPVTIGERLVTCVSQKIQPSLCAQLPINNSYFCIITPFLRIQHVLDSMLENFVWLQYKLYEHYWKKMQI